MTTQMAKVLLEVTAGVVPGVEEEQYRKQWAVTSEEWDQGSDEGFARLAERNGQMMGYAAMLQLQPHALNWVTTKWIWL